MTTTSPASLWPLLICLLALFPVHALASGVAARLLGAGVLSGVLLATAFGLRSSPRWFWGAVGLLIPAALLTWLELASDAEALRVSALLARLAFLGFATAAVLARVVGPGAVTHERLAGAAASYLLLGISWAFAYQAIEALSPGSFLPAAVERGDLFYFSFVTLTTLGYGDVVPVARVARHLALWEALAGQLFLAILVARLVGLQISSGPTGAAPIPLTSRPGERL